MSLQAPLNPFTRWLLVGMALIAFSLLADISRVMLQYGLSEQAGHPAFSITQAFRLITEPFTRDDAAHWVPTAAGRGNAIRALSG